MSDADVRFVVSMAGPSRDCAAEAQDLEGRRKPKSRTTAPAPSARVPQSHGWRKPPADIDDDVEDRARGGVQSIGRAFSILEEVARNRDGIGLADLGKKVGLHNSTTFHLVKTMVSLGYIRQLKDSKRYRIGRPLFALAASALDEMEMVSMATPCSMIYHARPVKAAVSPRA